MNARTAVALSAAITAPASAEIETITQRFILTQALVAPNAAIDFFAAVDLSTITGVGVESAVITAASVRLLQRDDPSSPFSIVNAGEIELPLDPYADAPLALRAEFVDGVFTDMVMIIDDPDNSGVNYLSAVNNSGFLGFFNIGGADVFSGPTILDIQRYVLESSSITPTPGTAGAVIAAGLFAARRRR